MRTLINACYTSAKQHSLATILRRCILHIDSSNSRRRKQREKVFSLVVFFLSLLISMPRIRCNNNSLPANNDAFRFNWHCPGEWASTISCILFPLLLLSSEPERKHKCCVSWLVYWWRALICRICIAYVVGPFCAFYLFPFSTMFYFNICLVRFYPRFNHSRLFRSPSLLRLPLLLFSSLLLLLAALL